MTNLRHDLSLLQKSDYTCIPHLLTGNQKTGHEPRFQRFTYRDGWVLSLLPGVLLAGAYGHTHAPLFSPVHGGPIAITPSFQQ